jgi:hypothetical protein
VQSGQATDDYGDQIALAYALRSRERHGVRLNGRCELCRVAWPCQSFWIAHHIVIRLTGVAQRGEG